MSGLPGVAPNPLETNPRVNDFVNDSIVQLLGELQDRPHSLPPISSDHPDVEMYPPQSDSEFLQAQDPAQYTISFDDTTQLQASATTMAIARLAEELEICLMTNLKALQMSLRERSGCYGASWYVP